MSLNDYPVKLTLRIDWSELDYFEHVNNVMFYKYIQSARVNFWDQFGMRTYHLEEKIGPILASCNCNFKKPLYFPGNVHIHSRLAFIKNTSFSFQHVLVDDAGDIAADAQDVMVMYDFNKNTKSLFRTFSDCGLKQKA
jgi:acyl-CoA thioester hydrolase